MTTEKQIWARKRNWLIRRLLGAKSIFSLDNIVFMSKSMKNDEDVDSIHDCEDAVDDLLAALRDTKRDS